MTNLLNDLTSWDIQRAAGRAPAWMLDTYEKIMIYSLASRGEKIIPSMTTLMNDMSASRDKVNKTKKALKEKGWLDYEPGNAHGDSNSYSLTVPSYVGRSKTTAKTGNVYTEFLYPSPPGPGEPMPWRTSTPVVLVSDSNGELPSTQDVLGVVRHTYQASTPHVLDLVRSTYSKSKREVEIEVPTIKNKPPLVVDDEISSLPLPEVADSRQDQALDHIDSEELSLPSSGSLPTATLGAVAHSTAASTQHVLGKPAPEFTREIDPQYLSPAPNRRTWLRNEETGHFWPAEVALPHFWHDAPTRVVYLTIMDRARLDRAGRIDYRGQLPQLEDDDDLMEVKYHRPTLQLSADDFEPTYNLNY